MAIGDFKVRTATVNGKSHAFLMRVERHGEVELLRAIAERGGETMALRELYRGVKSLLGLIEQAGRLSGEIDK